MDSLTEAIMDNMHLAKQWVGRRNRDWQWFFLRPYAFPAGAGLSWHTDGANGSGAFVYYVHPHWNVQWGSELLIIPQTYTQLPPLGSNDRSFDNSWENTMLMKTGIGEFIFPKTNRIIFLRGGTYHAIRKVDVAAGQNVRCTIAGLFLR